VLRVGRHSRAVQQQTAAGAWGSVAAQDEQLGVPHEQLQELRARLVLVRQEYRVKLDKLTEAMAGQVGGCSDLGDAARVCPARCAAASRGPGQCGWQRCQPVGAASAPSAPANPLACLPAGPGGDALPGGQAAGGLRGLTFSGAASSRTRRRQLRITCIGYARARPV
jgi:hypothetical protein